MKKFLKIFISLIIFGALAYQFRFTLITFGEQLLPFLENLQTKVQEKFFPQAPCAEPIPYTLGTFDTQFNISKNYFLSALLDAKAIWEKPLGKELFTYAPTNSNSNVLKINLIYDYRQQATSKLASLGIVVKRIEQQEQMQGGLYIPDSAKEKPQEGEVVSVGKGKRLEDGKIVPLDVQVGDRILFGKYSGSDIKIDGEEYMIMREDEVLGILEAAPTSAQKAS